MLQRVQSIYIALAVLLLVLSYSMSVLLLTLAVVAEVVLVFALFSYKNRSRQMRLCDIALVVETLWVVAFAGFYLWANDDGYLRLTFTAFLPLGAIIFTILARRGIKKDDDLVKSADRIR